MATGLSTINIAPSNEMKEWIDHLELLVERLEKLGLNRQLPYTFCNELTEACVEKWANSQHGQDTLSRIIVRQSRGDR